MCDMYECIICKDVMDKPRFAPCCKRIVGCLQCINQWFENHSTCPHCSTSGAAVAYMEVKGIYDTLCTLRTLCRSAVTGTAPKSKVDVATPALEAESDSAGIDFDTPAVAFRGTN